MRIGLFDPYLDTLGGGEKYILEMASCFSKNHDVYLFWDDKLTLENASDRFGFDFSRIGTAKNIFSAKYSLFKRYKEMKRYDLIVFLSDGSFPFLFAKKNILLFQFPINWVNGRNLLTKLKLRKINKIICYSDFVKKYLDKTFESNSYILPPAVSNLKEKSIEKENIILSVGRFTRAVNAKKQEFLIDAFKKMISQEDLKDWRLLIAGSVLPRDKDYVKELRKKTNGFPIDILDNVSFDELTNYYNKAKIYWHAAGYGEDLENHPEKAEHFGISTLEAMSCGVVPVVINAGGQKEIVENDKSGFLWDKLDELIEKTKLLIKDNKLRQRISEEAVIRSKYFNMENFCKNANNLLFDEK